MAPTPSRQTFREPPLREAILEFRFLPGERQWDSLMLGKIHDRIEDRFPNVKRVSSAPGIRIKSGAGEPQISIGGIEEGIRRFLSEDRSEVVTIGPGLMGVSELPRIATAGYPGWERLREIAFAIFDKYQEVVRPGPIARIGVRYINDLGITGDRKKLGDYIDAEANLVPPLLLGKDEPCGSRLDHRIGDEVRERLNIGIEEADGEKELGLRLRIDIDEVYDPAEPELLTERTIATTCDTLHDQAYHIFTTIMRDELLRTFDPIAPEPKGIT